MMVVDLSHWVFSIWGGHLALKGTPHYSESEMLNFADSFDLLLHLAADRTCESSIQNQVRRRLKEDPVAQQWHKQRTRLKSLAHFTKYRENGHYETYHDAARATALGTHTPEQQIMADGLNAEIGASAIVVPAGQIVFHGRADLDLHMSPPYPSFISTSLDPTVSVYHAIKRGLKTNTRPFVYVLTLTDPLHAIWGNGGSLDEWELLLKSGLACTQVQSHPGTNFDVVIANIGT